MVRSTSVTLAYVLPPNGSKSIRTSSTPPLQSAATASTYQPPISRDKSHPTVSVHRHSELLASRATFQPGACGRSILTGPQRACPVVLTRAPSCRSLPNLDMCTPQRIMDTSPLCNHRLGLIQWTFQEHSDASSTALHA